MDEDTMKDCVEESRFAGGGPIVATEHFVPSTTQTNFTSPSGLCMTPNGNLVVVDHKHGGVFVIEDGRTHLQSSTEEVEASEDVLLTEQRLLAPFGLACLDDGTILVADLLDNTIKSVKNGRVNRFAGGGHRGGEDGDFRSASFDKPKCLCITPRGDVLVSEVGSHRIRLIIMDYGGMVVTVAGEGPKGYREGRARHALFSHPSGLCCTRRDPTLSFLTYRPQRTTPNESDDESDTPSEMMESPRRSPRVKGSIPTFRLPPHHVGQFDDILIFVSDTQNHRIRVINDGLVWSLAGNGIPGLADGPCNLAQFDHPANICMAHRAILVADHRNDRIRFIDLQRDLVSSVRQSTPTLSSTPFSTLNTNTTPKSDELQVLHMERPSCRCINDQGELFVSCEYEAHADIHLLSQFTPMSASKSTPTDQRPLTYDTSASKRRLSSGAPSEHSQHFSNIADVGDEIEYQIQQLCATDTSNTAGKESPGHIEKLVARERSKSVDTGTHSLLSHGYQGWKRGTTELEPTKDGTASRSDELEPRGVVARLSRMLSLDEDAMTNRVDSLLEKLGLPPSARKSPRSQLREIQPFDPVFYDRTNESESPPLPPKKESKQSAHGKASVDHDEIDSDEIVTF